MTSWWNIVFMKFLAIEIMSWCNYELMKWQVDEMMSWRSNQLMKWWIYEISWYWNAPIMKCQLDDRPGWQNDGAPNIFRSSQWNSPSLDTARLDLIKKLLSKFTHCV